MNDESYLLFDFVLVGQDVDLRLDPRSGDPRLSRSIPDQDMRAIPSQLPNPLPPVGER